MTGSAIRTGFVDEAWAAHPRREELLARQAERDRDGEPTHEVARLVEDADEGQEQLVYAPRDRVTAASRSSGRWPSSHFDRLERDWAALLGEQHDGDGTSLFPDLPSLRGRSSPTSADGLREVAKRKAEPRLFPCRSPPSRGPSFTLWGAPRPACLPPDRRPSVVIRVRTAPAHPPPSGPGSRNFTKVPVVPRRGVGPAEKEAPNDPC